MGDSRAQVIELSGVGDGIRTRDVRNHNPTLYQAELHPPWRKGIKASLTQGYASPAFFQSSSTRARTSGDIRITSGQGRAKPS